MKKVLWVGNSMEIPGYGVGHKGVLTTHLPDDIADSFIKQGLAKEATKMKTTKKEKT